MNNTTKEGENQKLLAEEKRPLNDWEVKTEYIYKDDLAGLIHATISNSNIPQDLYDDILDRLFSYQPGDDLPIPLTLSLVVGALANGQRLDAEKIRAEEEAEKLEILENSQPFKDVREAYLAEVAAAKQIAQDTITAESLELRQFNLVQLLKFIKNDEENHFDLSSALFEWLEPQPDEYMNFKGMYLGEVFGCLSTSDKPNGTLTLEVEPTKDAQIIKSAYAESTENFSVKVIYLSEVSQ